VDTRARGGLVDGRVGKREGQEKEKLSVLREIELEQIHAFV
jgi:hypothetical protein